jgi:hypothetical protein
LIASTYAARTSVFTLNFRTPISMHSYMVFFGFRSFVFFSKHGAQQKNNKQNHHQNHGVTYSCYSRKHRNTTTCKTCLILSDMYACMYLSTCIEMYACMYLLPTCIYVCICISAYKCM